LFWRLPTLVIEGQSYIMERTITFSSARDQFAAGYKSIYLVAMLANATAMIIEAGFGYDSLWTTLICALFFALNTISWIGYHRGRQWAFDLEQTLSIGRMVMILFASTIFLADVVALYSPVGWLLWYKLMLLRVLDDRDHIWYWMGCGTLLLLEGLYFSSLIQRSAQHEVLAVT